MPILQLIEEAGSLFGLDPEQIFLVLFSASPTTLKKENTVTEPPRIAPNAVMMVFYVPKPVFRHDDGFRPPTEAGGSAFQMARAIPNPRS
jgi:hypothetical protein